jgi:hypothetical protein
MRQTRKGSETEPEPFEPFSKEIDKKGFWRHEQKKKNEEAKKGYKIKKKVVAVVP